MAFFASCTSDETITETPPSTTIPESLKRAIIINTAMNSGRLSDFSALECQAGIFYDLVVNGITVLSGYFPINGELGVNQTYDEGATAIVNNYNSTNPATPATTQDIRFYRVEVTIVENGMTLQYVFTTNAEIFTYFEDCSLEGIEPNSSSTNTPCHVNIVYPVTFIVADVANPLNQTTEITLNNDVALLELFQNPELLVLDAVFPIAVTVNTTTINTTSYEAFEDALASTCE